MKHILLLSNIITERTEIIEYAVNFCLHYSCKLHVLHIDHHDESVLISTPHYYQRFSLSSRSSAVRKDLNEKFSSFITPKIESDWQGIVLKTGEEETVLADFIHEQFIDLVLVGNITSDRSKQGLIYKNILFNVIKTPLLVVPDFKNFRPLKQLNFLIKPNEREVAYILKASALFPKAQITATSLEKDEEIFINSPIHEYLTKKLSSRYKFQFSALTMKSYVSKGNKLVHNTFDGIVFTTHQRSFWIRFFDKSTTVHLLSNLELPAIILKRELKI